MKEAIKKAIEGGYQGQINGDIIAYLPGDNNFILLDPLFWQCLGEALNMIGSRSPRIEDLKLVEEYKIHWHRFIDHIADGGNVDDFFNNLLTGKK